MRRTVIYIIISLITASVQASIDLMPFIKYSLKNKICSLNLKESIHFKNEELNQLLLENISQEEIEILKMEFCDQSITK